MFCGIFPGLPAGLPAGGFVGSSAPPSKSSSSWQTGRPTAPGTSWTPQAKPAPRASEQLRSHFSVIGAREERGVRVPSFGKLILPSACLLFLPSEPAKTAIFISLTDTAPRKQMWICVLVSSGISVGLAPLLQFSMAFNRWH